MGGDVGVRRARQAPPQLTTPVAGEHGVRVRIDEPRHHRAAARVELRTATGELTDAPPFGRVTDEHDAAVQPCDDRMLERRHVTLRRSAARRRAGARHHLRCVDDDEVSFHRDGPPDVAPV